MMRRYDNKSTTASATATTTTGRSVSSSIDDGESTNDSTKKTKKRRRMDGAGEERTTANSITRYFSALAPPAVVVGAAPTSALARRTVTDTTTTTATRGDGDGEEDDAPSSSYVKRQQHQTRKNKTKNSAGGAVGAAAVNTTTNNRISIAAKENRLLFQQETRTATTTSSSRNAVVVGGRGDHQQEDAGASFGSTATTRNNKAAVVVVSTTSSKHGLRVTTKTATNVSCSAASSDASSNIMDEEGTRGRVLASQQRREEARNNEEGQAQQRDWVRRRQEEAKSYRDKNEEDVNSSGRINDSSNNNDNKKKRKKLNMTEENMSNDDGGNSATTGGPIPFEGLKQQKRNTINEKKRKQPQLLRKNVVYQLMDRSVFGSNAGIDCYLRQRAGAAPPAAVLDLSRKTLNPETTAASLAAAAERSTNPSGVQIPRGGQCWKMSSWIELNGMYAGRGESSSANNIPTTRLLAWDCVGGVLLATTVQDNVVRIYDWDTVWPADQKGRNMTCRRLSSKAASGGEEGAATSTTKSGAFSIEPVLTFVVDDNKRPTGPREGGGTLLTFLAWNIINADELLVGTRAGNLFVYDVAEMNEWVQQQQPRPAAAANPQPRRTFACGSNPMGVTDAIGAAVFVEDNKGRYLLVVGSGCNLFCFDAATRKKLWKLDWNGKRVTCLSPVHHHAANHRLLLVGSACGHFCLVDYTRYELSSFATLASPKVLREWLSYQGLETPGTTHMGIQSMVLETVSAPNDATYAPRRFRIRWITPSGWVLRSSVDISASTKTAAKQNHGASLCSVERAEILFSTAPVRVLNDRGDRVIPNRRSWSLPVGTCTSHCTRDLLVFEDVAGVTQILPHHDNRVLVSQPRFVREPSRPKLRFIWTTPDDPTISEAATSSSALHSCTLSRRRGRPVAVAIHPSHEWIVVSTDKRGMYALSSRANVGVADKAKREE